MANNIDIIQLTKYDGTPFYPLVDVNSVAGLSTRLNTIGNNITSLQNGLTTLQGRFDANGRINYANLPNLYIGNAQVQSSAQTAQGIGGLGTLLPGINNAYDIGSSSLVWKKLYANEGTFYGKIYADEAQFDGLVNLNSDLHVSGGDVYVSGETEVGSIYSYGQIYTEDRLWVDGDATINGDLYLKNNLYFGPDDDISIYWYPNEEVLIFGSIWIYPNGTIEDATWHGSNIAVNYGGTGKSSWIQNGVVYASGITSLAQVANVTGNSQKKFLVQTTNASGTAQAPAWGGIDQRDVLGTSDIGSTSLPVYYKGASNYALAPITDLDLLSQAASHGYVKAKRFYLSSDVYFEWIAPTSTTDGYVKLNAPLLTTGDQIVGDGTPGGGGGGGSTPYLTDLLDVIQGIQPSANKMLIWTSQGTNNAGTTGGWTLIDKSSVGVSTDATQSAHGLMSTADKIKLDSIQFGTQASDYIPITIGSTTQNVLIAHQSLAAYATQNWVTQQITNLNLGTAATYSVGSVASGNTGLVTGGAVWSAIDSLPEPMVFKGSLGTGGTITTLPAASSANEGYTYKVITAGTYASKTAKVGDTFISTGSEWVLIPSGDEPNGTVTSVGLTVPTGLSVSGSPITTSGTLAITFASGYSIPTTANQTAWSTASGYFSNGILPVSHGGTGKDTLTSGSALIGNGTSAVTLRAITNNTVATAVTASTNLITANTLYYHKGNSNIVTVGTITSGTWHGSTIDNDYITNHTITVGSTVFNLGDTKTSLAGLVNVTMTGTLKIGDAEITWDGTNGYLKINKPLLTLGDQIVGSGTPGGGGGGGGAGFLYELGDVLTDSGNTVVKQYDGTTNAANNNLFAFNGSKWYALKLGSNLAISSGTLNATNTTYSNGTGLDLSNGVFSITPAYQTKIDNGASAYSTLTTSQTKNKVLASPSNASGAPSFRALVAADLPSIENLTNFSTRVYDATTSRTANYVLAAPNGSNGAATFRKLVAADIPSLTVSKISDIASNYVSIATANTITAKHTFSNGILLNTASSWTSSDRAIAFSADGEDANLRYYNTDSNKGLTFNPNTGELKAAKFTRRGGTSSQFLKADGSVDSNTYLTGNQTITLSGDVSGSGTTSINVSIGSGKVTNAMLAGSIANGKLANSAITINGSSTSLGGSFNTASITAGTAGTSSATSGLSISVPYVTMNSYGIVTGYGTHTHSISKSDLTTALEGSSGYYVKKAGDTMSGDLIIEKTGGGLTIRGERLNSNANGGYIYLAGRYYDNDRNGVKIAAEYPGSVAYDIQDLVIYTSYNRSGNASPVWQEAMRIAAQGQTFINGQYTYSLYIDNVASGATSAGIRFRTEGTTVGGIFVNSSNDLYFSAGSSSTGSKVLTADNYDGYALPLAGGTMAGSIKLPNGSYINAESGYAMCGIGSGGETFYCGPGAEITNAFYLRSGDINLTHVKAGTNYTIWDASNSNLSTVDWAANNITAAGTGTFNKIALTSTAAEAHLAFARGGYNYITAPEGGSINIVPNGLSVSAANSRLSVADSEVAITKASGEAMLAIQSTAANGAAGSIWFRARSSSYNGIMLVGNPGATSNNAYDRISLDFMAANATSSSSVTWKRALRITYGGNVIVGASGATSTYTQYGNMTVNGSITSTGDQVISSDATLKTNWKELNYTVKDIANVKIGIFDWKDGHGTSAGSVAQDWKKLVPELVHGDEGNMTLAYGQIALLNTVLLARHEDEQDKEIKELKEKIKELEDKVRQLTTN